MENKELRTGFTTGTAAAAASKAAVYLLIKNELPQQVSVLLLTGERIQIPIESGFVKGNAAECTVRKDAGDDPDITHKAIIGSRVTFITSPQSANHNPRTVIRITGGHGVGTVTKPGLEVPPGEPAINPGPKKMITQSVIEVLQECNIQNIALNVEIFVPEGIDLAKKTLNAKLGIIGGISILGTTGIVKPLSHEAYIATIKSAISVAYAAGIRTIVLTTGRRSERFAQEKWSELPVEAFVQIGDYFKDSVTQAAESGFHKIILAVFFGKAVKMAQGFPNTHAANARLDTESLAEWAKDVTHDNDLYEKIRKAVAARHVLELVRNNHKKVIHEVGKRMMLSAKNFAGSGVILEGYIFDYNGGALFADVNQE